MGFTQPLTEMSIRSRKILFLGSRARAVRKANNLTAICEPIVYIMWNPSHPTTLQASTSYYRDSFTLFTKGESSVLKSESRIPLLIPVNRMPHPSDSLSFNRLKMISEKKKFRVQHTSIEYIVLVYLNTNLIVSS
jgi:hypothetical protein